MATIAEGNRLDAGDQGPASPWLDSVRSRWVRHKRFRQMLKELQSLTDRELADIDLGPAYIRDIARKAAYGNPK